MGEAGGGLPENSDQRACMEVPVKPRRPPSLPLICVLFPDHSSFSVLRETPMASAINVQFQKANMLQTWLFTQVVILQKSFFQSIPIGKGLIPACLFFSS
jgi:hypothetical protein